MKRDSKLLAKILLTIEDDNWRPGLQLAVEGHTNEQIGYHIAMLGQAGLLKVADATLSDGVPCALPIAMTNMGHDFLEAARDDTLWNKLKDRFSGLAVDMTLEILRRWIVAP